MTFASSCDLRTLSARITSADPGRQVGLHANEIRRLIWGLSAPLLLSVATGALTDFGRDARPAFYAAMATIVPVLLLSLMVEMVGYFRITERRQQLEATIDEGEKILADLSPNDPATYETVDQALDEARGAVARLLALPRQLRLWTNLAFGNAVLAETTALYALASGQSTTFLLVACCLNVFGLVAALILVYNARFADEPY